MPEIIPDNINFLPSTTLPSFSIPIEYYIFFAVFVILAGGLVYYLKKQKKIKELLKSLDFILYEITLPQENPEQNKPENKNKGVKELTMIMEQLFESMSSVESYFALEIGIPSKGNELVFYAAIEKKQAQMFEKQVQGHFPNANLIIKEGDYNIFKPEGFAAASSASLKKNSFLPIKIYDKFESDPLGIIINVFSKLKKEGDGAAFQLIVSPKAKSGFDGRLKKVISEIRKGKSLSEAMKGGNESLGLAFFKELGGLFFGGLADASGFGDKDKDKKDKEPKPPDEELVALLESKASRRIMSANLRLIVSSSDSQEKAKSILSELESAFLQFDQNHGNGFKFSSPSRWVLKDLLYKFSFRIPDTGKFLSLNTAELATIFHLPLGIMATAAPQLKYIKTKEAPPPLNLPSEGVLLGKNTYRGEMTDVYMKQDDRRRHFYTIGQTGTGKSVLLKNMMIQDIEAGRGICFIDPHGSDLQDILSRIPPERADDVIYFNPGDVARPMGLNMLEYDSRYPEQKIFIVNELLGIFNKLFDMKVAGGPMFEQYFRNAAMLVMESPSLGNTLVELGRVLSDKAFRDQKMAACVNPIVKAFWRDVAEKAGGEASLQNIVPYITSKFDTFLSNDIMRPIISQEKSSFSFRDVMDSQKILLVNLSKGRLGDINSNLLGLIIVGKILMASLSRVDMPASELKDFYLYIDEFQNVTTDSISTILSEARKYKLNLTVAHQFIGQLEEGIKKSIFGNVGSMVSFRIGVEDGEFLQKQFEPVFNAHDLINIDNYNAYIKLLIDGQTARPFSIQTLPFKKGEPWVAEEISKLSSLKFGRPREEVEEEVNKRYEKK